MATGAIAIGTTVSWGIANNHYNVGNIKGIVVGWRENKGYEKADCRNEVGSKIGESVYDVTYAATATIQCQHGTEVPTATTLISVGNRTYRVVNGEVTESNQDYTKISLNLEASAYNFTPTLAEGVSI